MKIIIGIIGAVAMGMCVLGLAACVADFARGVARIVKGGR